MERGRNFSWPRIHKKQRLLETSRNGFRRLFGRKALSPKTQSRSLDCPSVSAETLFRCSWKAPRRPKGRPRPSSEGLLVKIGGVLGTCLRMGMGSKSKEKGTKKKSKEWPPTRRFNFFRKISLCRGISEYPLRLAVIEQGGFRCMSS